MRNHYVTEDLPARMDIASLIEVWSLSLHFKADSGVIDPQNRPKQD
jgi:hypothetical protein